MQLFDSLSVSREPTVTFLGQTGFIFRLANGVTIGVDLYLSNCCERYFGFKRLMPYLVNPLELNLDFLIASHAHYDHFDPDAVPLMMANPTTRLLAAYDVKPEAERLHLDESRITYLRDGDVFEDERFTVKAVPCDHGVDTPDAIGLLLCFDGKTVYMTGDTAYRPDYFEEPDLHQADLLILPINGAFGNMNEAEAAKASAILNAKLTVPAHYWNFAEHGGNPARFCEAMKALPEKHNYLIMRPGETIAF
ncbi:MAG: MBL fold metallo-hydrolase [Clostridia bacterium]|nr:MBL fold metallo-hydrolase [Clostridia bacterium]